MINGQNLSSKQLIPTVQQITDFGTSEPFVARISLGLSDLLNGIDINQKQKKEMQDLIFDTFQELSNAFIALQEIRAIETEKKQKLLLNQRKGYLDVYGYCWASYKDRMPKILRVLGFNLAFLFGNDKTYNRGSNKFKKLHPKIGDEFIIMVLNDRKTWQNTVSKIRNYYKEHKKSSKITDEQMKKYFNLQTTQLVFNNCWQAIEDIVIMCFTTKCIPGTKIGKIPKTEINRKCPKKFCLYTSKNDK